MGFVRCVQLLMFWRSKVSIMWHFECLKILIMHLVILLVKCGEDIRPDHVPWFKFCVGKCIFFYLSDHKHIWFVGSTQAEFIVLYVHDFDHVSIKKFEMTGIIMFWYLMIHIYLIWILSVMKNNPFLRLF